MSCARFCMGLYQVLWIFPRFYQVFLELFFFSMTILLGFVVFDEVISGFIGFHRVLLGFIRFEQVLPGFIGL